MQFTLLDAHINTQKNKHGRVTYTVSYNVIAQNTVKNVIVKMSQPQQVPWSEMNLHRVSPYFGNTAYVVWSATSWPPQTSDPRTSGSALNEFTFVAATSGKQSGSSCGCVNYAFSMGSDFIHPVTHLISGGTLTAQVQNYNCTRKTSVVFWHRKADCNTNNNNNKDKEKTAFVAVNMSQSSHASASQNYIVYTLPGQMPESVEYYIQYSVDGTSFYDSDFGRNYCYYH